MHNEVYLALMESAEGEGMMDREGHLAEMNDQELYDYYYG